MYYIYILQSTTTREFYIGYTHDLKKRIALHKDGKNQSTKHASPWLLIFYEAYCNKYDALRRERYLKTGKGWTTWKSMLREYLGTR